MQAARYPRAFYWLTGALLFVTGSAVAYQSCNWLAMAFDSQTWPSVEGRVLDWEEAAQKRAEGARGRAWYSYVVDAQTHTSSRLEFVSLRSRGLLNGANSPAARPGDAVSVYYDPKAPEESVLRTGPNGFAFAVPLLSVGLMALGYATARLGFRKHEQ